MKVSELIAALQAWPADLDVAVYAQAEALPIVHVGILPGAEGIVAIVPEQTEPVLSTLQDIGGAAVRLFAEALADRKVQLRLSDLDNPQVGDFGITHRESAFLKLPRIDAPVGEWELRTIIESVANAIAFAQWDTIGKIRAPSVPPGSPTQYVAAVSKPQQLALLIARRFDPVTGAPVLSLDVIGGKA